jgi:hypothetical protein
MSVIGPLIKNVEIFTIFWGNGWQQAPASGLISQVNEFFSYIVTSPLIDQLAEYSVPGQSIGHGSMVGTIFTTTPPLHRSVSDAAIQHMLQRSDRNKQHGTPAKSGHPLFHLRAAWHKSRPGRGSVLPSLLWISQ